MNDGTTESVQTQQPDETMIHDISVETEDNSGDDLPMKNTLIIFALIIVLGIVTGFGFSYFTGGSSKATNVKSGESMSGGKDVVESAGIADPETFTDSAEGTLEKKSKDDPQVGNYKLVRPGGEDQTAFLTSSTVDLSEFVGKKVRVYGETFASDEVGWLMDVGFIEVLQ